MQRRAAAAVVSRIVGDHGDCACLDRLPRAVGFPQVARRRQAEDRLAQHLEERYLIRCGVVRTQHDRHASVRFVHLHVNDVPPDARRVGRHASIHHRRRQCVELLLVALHGGPQSVAARLRVRDAAAKGHEQPALQRGAALAANDVERRRLFARVAECGAKRYVTNRRPDAGNGAVLGGDRRLVLIMLAHVPPAAAVQHVVRRVRPLDGALAVRVQHDNERLGVIEQRPQPRPPVDRVGPIVAIVKVARRPEMPLLHQNDRARLELAQPAASSKEGTSLGAAPLPVDGTIRGYEIAKIVRKRRRGEALHDWVLHLEHLGPWPRRQCSGGFALQLRPRDRVAHEE